MDIDPPSTTSPSLSFFRAQTPATSQQGQAIPRRTSTYDPSPVPLHQSQSQSQPSTSRATTGILNPTSRPTAYLPSPDRSPSPEINATESNVAMDIDHPIRSGPSSDPFWSPITPPRPIPSSSSAASTTEPNIGLPTPNSLPRNHTNHLETRGTGGGGYLDDLDEAPPFGENGSRDGGRDRVFGEPYERFDGGGGGGNSASSSPRLDLHLGDPFNLNVLAESRSGESRTSSPLGAFGHSRYSSIGEGSPSSSSTMSGSHQRYTLASLLESGLSSSRENDDRGGASSSVEPHRSDQSAEAESGPTTIHADRRRSLVTLPTLRSPRRGNSNQTGHTEAPSVSPRESLSRQLIPRLFSTPVSTSFEHGSSRDPTAANSEATASVTERSFSPAISEVGSNFATASSGSSSPVFLPASQASPQLRPRDADEDRPPMLDLAPSTPFKRSFEEAVSNNDGTPEAGPSSSSSSRVAYQAAEAGPGPSSLRRRVNSRESTPSRYRVWSPQFPSYRNADSVSTMSSSESSSRNVELDSANGDRQADRNKRSRLSSSEPDQQGSFYLGAGSDSDSGSEGVRDREGLNEGMNADGGSERSASLSDWYNGTGGTGSDRSDMQSMSRAADVDSDSEMDVSDGLPSVSREPSPMRSDPSQASNTFVPFLRSTDSARNPHYSNRPASLPSLPESFTRNTAPTLQSLSGSSFSFDWDDDPAPNAAGSGSATGEGSVATSSAVALPNTTLNPAHADGLRSRSNTAAMDRRRATFQRILNDELSDPFGDVDRTPRRNARSHLPELPSLTTLIRDDEVLERRIREEADPWSSDSSDVAVDRLNSLPSLHHLPHPNLTIQRPVIGVRRGEGWQAPRHPPQAIEDPLTAGRLRGTAGGIRAEPHTRDLIDILRQGRPTDVRGLHSPHERERGPGEVNESRYGTNRLSGSPAAHVPAQRSSDAASNGHRPSAELREVLGPDRSTTPLVYRGFSGSNEPRYEGLDDDPIESERLERLQERLEILRQRIVARDSFAEDMGEDQVAAEAIGSIPTRGRLRQYLEDQIRDARRQHGGSVEGGLEERQSRSAHNDRRGLLANLRERVQALHSPQRTANDDGAAIARHDSSASTSARRPHLNRNRTSVSPPELSPMASPMEERNRPSWNEMHRNEPNVQHSTGGDGQNGRQLRLPPVSVTVTPSVLPETPLGVDTESETSSWREPYYGDIDSGPAEASGPSFSQRRPGSLDPMGRLRGPSRLQNERWLGRLGVDSSRPEDTLGSGTSVTGRPSIRYLDTASSFRRRAVQSGSLLNVVEPPAHGPPARNSIERIPPINDVLEDHLQVADGSGRDRSSPSTNRLSTASSLGHRLPLFRPVSPLQTDNFEGGPFGRATSDPESAAETNGPAEGASRSISSSGQTSRFATPPSDTNRGSEGADQMQTRLRPLRLTFNQHRRDTPANRARPDLSPFIGDDLDERQADADWIRQPPLLPAGNSGHRFFPDPVFLARAEEEDLRAGDPDPDYASGLFTRSSRPSSPGRSRLNAGRRTAHRTGTPNPDGIADESGSRSGPRNYPYTYQHGSRRLREEQGIGPSDGPSGRPRVDSYGHDHRAGGEFGEPPSIQELRHRFRLDNLRDRMGNPALAQIGPTASNYRAGLVDRNAPPGFRNRAGPSHAVSPSTAHRSGDAGGSAPLAFEEPAWGEAEGSSGARPAQQRRLPRLSRLPSFSLLPPHTGEGRDLPRRAEEEEPTNHSAGDRLPPVRRARELLLEFEGLWGGGGLTRDLAAEYHGFALFGNSVAADPRNYMGEEEFDTSYEGLLRLQERLGDAIPRGTPSSVISSFEKFHFRERPVMAETRCSICLEDYKHDDLLMSLKCRHALHSQCLETWITSTPSCPICRKSTV